MEVKSFDQEAHRLVTVAQDDLLAVIPQPLTADRSAVPNRAAGAGVGNISQGRARSDRQSTGDVLHLAAARAIGVEADRRIELRSGAHRTIAYDTGDLGRPAVEDVVVEVLHALKVSGC